LISAREVANTPVQMKKAPPAIPSKPAAMIKTGEKKFKVAGISNNDESRINLFALVLFSVIYPYKMLIQ